MRQVPKLPLLPHPGPWLGAPGQWLALLGRQVTGRGRTAAEARRQSQFSRPRERPLVLYMPEMPLPPIALPDLLDEIRPLLPQPDAVWAVGGVVRDGLLGRPAHDIDLVVAEGATRLARRLADGLAGKYYLLDAERGTGRALVERDGVRWVIDVATLRGPTLAEDLMARDFTINALAMPLGDSPTLIDPSGGYDDLMAKLVRQTTAEALPGDPVRCLRAVRLANQLSFRIDPATREAVRDVAPELVAVSAERVRDELFKVLSGPQPSAALRVLMHLKVLPVVIPEVTPLVGCTQSPPHHEDVWGHTLSVVARLDKVLGVLGETHDIDAASSVGYGTVAARVGNFRREIAARMREELSVGRDVRGLMMLAALLHDIGKPDTRTVANDDRIHFYRHEEVGSALAAKRLKALKFATAEVDFVTRLVRHHLYPRQLDRPDPLPRKLLYRYHRKTSPVGVEACLLAVADELAKRGVDLQPDDWMQFINRVVELVNAYYRQHDEVVAPPALVSGHALMETLDLREGPQLGKLLESIREAQAVGEVTTADEALAFARRWLRRKDNKPGAV